MSLSNGFIRRFFGGEDMQKFTPVLRVESITKRHRFWILNDGEQSAEFGFKDDSGPYERVKSGTRLILHQFHHCGRKQHPKSQIGIIERLI